MSPSTMKAVRLFEYGQPEVLRYVEVPVPEIGPDEVLVRVRATSVTRWDLRYRQGLLTPPPGRAALPLAEAVEAHRILERQEQFGKIVLLP